MDNEKDIYIKEKLQKDTLISKKADSIIGNFFDMEDVKMEENKIKDKKVLFPKKWKKILATVASVVVIFGAANVYASTKGYGNIFFLIKYLITGENSYEDKKENILSDRDITISYEPIAITENMSIIIKKLQIINNEARLFVFVNEKGKVNSEDVPLKYIVMNDKNETLCDQKSSRIYDSISYTDELIIKNFKESDEKLKLEIYKANSDLITTINIDLKNQTIEVAGEEEALSKISEIKLKEFLNYVSGLSKSSNNLKKDEVLIDLAINMLSNKELDSGILITRDGGQTMAFPADKVKQMIKNSFGDYNIDDFQSGNYITKIKNNGNDFYIYVAAGDFTFVGECININDISWNNGIYTVNYTFYHPGIEPMDEVNMDNYDIYGQTVYIKLNENNHYSDFKLLSMENPELLQKSKASNNNEINTNTGFEITTPTNNNNTNTTVNNSGNNKPSNNNSSSVNNTAVNNNTTTNNNINDNTNSNSNNSSNSSTNNNPNNGSDSNANNNSENLKIDNYASSMNWTGYWAPGLKFQYPTDYTLVEEGGFFRGNNQGELTTRITGVAIGKNPDTNERIDSKLIIKTYNPKFVSEDEMKAKVYPNGVDERGSFQNNRGIKWYVIGSNETGETGYTYSERYSNFEKSSDGSYVETQIEFVTDNIENYKVRNIINWVLGSTQLTSW